VRRLEGILPHLHAGRVGGPVRVSRCGPVGR
jgi:hypothetical protein